MDDQTDHNQTNNSDPAAAPPMPPPDPALATPPPPTSDFATFQLPTVAPSSHDPALDVQSSAPSVPPPTEISDLSNPTIPEPDRSAPLPPQAAADFSSPPPESNFAPRTADATPPPPEPVAPAPLPPASPDIPTIQPGQHYRLMPSSATPNQPTQPVSSLDFEAQTSTATVAANNLGDSAVQNVVPPPEFMNQPTPTKSSLIGRVRQHHLWPKIRPWLGTALIALIIYGVFDSQLLIGQIKYFISPGATAQTPATIQGPVSPNPALIIPKINLNVPVVYTVRTFDEAEVQQALQSGVVHYGTTALPGQIGNGVIVGHSSNSWWVPGKYKFAFVLLSKLDPGDVFYLNYKAKRYTYQVVSKKIIEPTDTNVLSQDVSTPTFTLITCDPPGTSWHRLAISAKQIDPDPTKDTQSRPSGPSQQVPIPGDGSSLFDRILHWL